MYARGEVDEVDEEHPEEEYYDTSEEDEEDEENEPAQDDPIPEEEFEGDADAEEDIVAEKEIDNDFERLVQDIKSKNDPNKTGLLAKDWDISIADKEEEAREKEDAQFKDDLRAATGIGKRKRRRRTFGPPLSHQVRSLIGEGNQAYINDDIPLAIRTMQEVIRIEPRAADAWSVLAQCYTDKGERDRGVQLRIMKAHLTRDSEEWEDLAVQSKEMGHHQQALYCYRKVYSLNPDNIDALWDRATLSKEIGDMQTTRRSLLAILKRLPHDLVVLTELRPILIDLNDLTTCTSLFSGAFAHYSAAFASRPQDVPAPGFGLMEILVLADLHNTLSEYQEAVETIRKGCRWLQGRANQVYWDRAEDDREYDLIDTIREDERAEGAVEPGRYELDVNARHRLAVARIKMGHLGEGKIHANIVLNQDIYDYAPLFVELADAYFERDMFAEARPIYELLGTDETTSSIYVLLQAAACLRSMGELKEAAEVYEQVRVVDPTDSETKMKLADIYEVLGETRRALDLVYEVIGSRKKRARNDTSERNESLVPGTTSLFAEQGQMQQQQQQPVQPARFAKQKDPNRLTPAQVRELEAQREKEVIRGFAKLKALEAEISALGPEPDVDAGVLKMNEWILEAEKLSDAFRETRALFSAIRHHPFKGVFPRRGNNKGKKRKQGGGGGGEENEEEEDRMMARLQLDIEHERRGGASGSSKSIVGLNVFRGISFDEWLKMFMKYSFHLTKRGQFEVAEEVLKHILLSNAFASARHYQDTIRISLMTCAIHAQRYTTCVEQSRKIITSYQFNNEPFRLLVASLSAGLRPTDSFITSPLQKATFREVKMADAAVTKPETLKWMPVTKRYSIYAQSKGEEEEEEDDDPDDDAAGDKPGEDNKLELPKLPTKLNPVVVGVYGQICIAAKSYQSAIFYLLHAYDYCPDDPMICLSLAIASAGRAMQRQSDNRHHLITQCMAFLSRYRALRGKDWEGMSEVEFNFGRMFQQLGLLSHAVKHYEHVLELAERGVTKDGGMAREAAYNLSLIYVTTGATPLAQLLYRRWLSV